MYAPDFGSFSLPVTSTLKNIRIIGAKKNAITRTASGCSSEVTFGIGINFCFLAMATPRN
jgi:hypothetical protein